MPSRASRESLGKPREPRSERDSDTSGNKQRAGRDTCTRHRARASRRDFEAPLLYTIEDDTEFWGTIELILESEYRLRFFGGFECCTRALQEEPLPDVLLVDVIFPPDRDAGFKYVRELRASLPALPVLFISGRNDYEAGLQARDLDAGFVHKAPGRFKADLYAELARLLPSSLLHKELRVMSGIEDLVLEVYGKRFSSCSPRLQEILQMWFSTMSSIGANVEHLAELAGISPGTLNRILQQDFPKENAKEFLVHLSTAYGAALYRCGYSSQDVCQRIGMSRARFYENCKRQLFLNLSVVRSVPLSRVLRGPEA